MSASLSVRLDASGVPAAFDWYGLQIAVATMRALNRTANQVKTAMYRAVADETGLRVGKVRDEMRVLGASTEDLTARVKVSGRRIPLIEFHARGPEPSRGKGAGVSYRIGSRTGRLPHAFIATMPSGHRGVFLRRGAARGPIVEMRGPSLPHIFMKKTDVGRAKATEVLNKNLAHEVKFILKGK